jgi:hypothetical protein
MRARKPRREARSEARLTRIDDPMENQRPFSRCGLDFLPRGSASVGFRQIFADELGIRVADRRVVDLDHLSDLSVLERLAPLGRLRFNVVARVA